MPRGDYRQTIRCAAPGCRETITYRHETRRDEVTGGRPAILATCPPVTFPRPSVCDLSGRRGTGAVSTDGIGGIAIMRPQSGESTASLHPHRSRRRRGPFATALQPASGLRWRTGATALPGNGASALGSARSWSPGPTARAATAGGRSQRAPSISTTLFPSRGEGAASSVTSRLRVLYAIGTNPTCC